jgi:MFS family permease
MLMDISSELIHSLLPVFMASVLGTSMATIGVVEGTAEAATSVVKVFSGALSDHLRRRKRLVVLGYLLAAITKPAFPLASSIGWVFAARFVDRIGKGIREAPRDALMADIISPDLRGAAYGLRQALDSVGAFCGPLLAVLLMGWLVNDIRSVMWAAVVPAFAAVVLLATFVREPERRSAAADAPFALATIHKLPRMYWFAVAVGALFTLARFSDAFLVLRALDVGLTAHYVPLVLIVMNVVYASCAFPAGLAADHIGSTRLLLAGLVLLIGADLMLAAANSSTGAFFGAGLWGLQMAATQGLFGKLVADAAPPQMRGTAFGVFNLCSGAALLIASPIAGVLWSRGGPSTTFLVGAGFAALSACGLLGYGLFGLGQRTTVLRR